MSDELDSRKKQRTHQVLQTREITTEEAGIAIVALTAKAVVAHLVVENVRLDVQLKEVVVLMLVSMRYPRISHSPA